MYESEEIESLADRIVYTKIRQEHSQKRIILRCILYERPENLVNRYFTMTGDKAKDNMEWLKLKKDFLEGVKNAVNSRRDI